MPQFTMSEQIKSKISCRAEQVSNPSPLCVYALDSVKHLSLSLQVKRMTRYTLDIPDTFTPDTFTPDTPIRCYISVCVRGAALTHPNRFAEPVGMRIQSYLAEICQPNQPGQRPGWSEQRL
jgi:hypothetical protein